MNHSNTITSTYGVKMPRLIYGTAWKKERTASLVQQAIIHGFRGIDTACQPKHYFEPGVGDALIKCYEQGISREQIYLQSKFTPLNGHDPAQIPYDPKAELKEQVAQSFHVSLKNLKTHYLDGLILHSPLAEADQLLEVWRAMETIYHTGDAKQLGISNCYSLETFGFLYENATVKPAILQNRFYADTGYDRALREFCHQQSVIYQSFWTLTANPKVLASGTIDSLSARYQRTPAQIFFRYLTQIGVLPLTGTTSTEHMLEDLAIFEFELTEEECGEISGLL
ncbi:aldo/keto reductase family protein [Methylomonas sp. MgM2]